MMSNHKSSTQKTDTSTSGYPIDLEKLLSDGHTIQIKPQGYSMYPLFLPGRDEALIQSTSPSALHRGDVVLYRRDEGILVLHRIWKINQKGFYMVGDNQTEIEGPLRPDQIRGLLTGMIRNGNYISVQALQYRIITGIWLRLRPFRPIISKAASRIKRLFPRFLKV